MGSSTIGLSKKRRKTLANCPNLFGPLFAVPGGPRKFEKRFWGRIPGHWPTIYLYLHMYTSI